MQNTIIKSIVSLGLSCLSLSVLAAAVPQQPVDKNQASAVTQQRSRLCQHAVLIRM